MTGASDGAKALELVLAQAEWTHRRVESLAFEANGETRRRVSWDFTVPDELTIQSSGGRVAIPLATLRKVPLKRLDVRDAAGQAIPVWGKQENGQLAVAALQAAVGSGGPDPLSSEMAEAIERVVYAPSAESVEQDIAVLTGGLKSTDNDDARDLAIALRSLVTTLADSFLFVVELPRDVVGRRTIVKASYEDERSKRSRSQVNLLGRTEVDIEANGWGYARSWHLEVQAPTGLLIDELRYETWDPESLDLTSDGTDSGGTAHVTTSGVLPYDGFSCFARLAPARSSLLNPLMLGSILSAALLWLTVARSNAIAEKLSMPGGAASLGAVLFGLPAFFFAMLSRRSEHELVSKVLLGPRLASLGCALVLWAAGLILVWRPTASHLEASLVVLAIAQSATVAWLAVMRAVGGDN